MPPSPSDIHANFSRTYAAHIDAADRDERARLYLVSPQADSDLERYSAEADRDSAGSMAVFLMVIACGLVGVIFGLSVAAQMIR
jgi:hypothetical protein